MSKSTSWMWFTASHSAVMPSVIAKVKHRHRFCSPTHRIQLRKWLASVKKADFTGRNTNWGWAACIDRKHDGSCCDLSARGATITISITKDALPTLFTIIDTSTRRTRPSYAIECRWPAATDSEPLTLTLSPTLSLSVSVSSTTTTTTTTTTVYVSPAMSSSDRRIESVAKFRVCDY